MHVGGNIIIRTLYPYPSSIDRLWEATLSHVDCWAQHVMYDPMSIYPRLLGGVCTVLCWLLEAYIGSMSSVVCMHLRWLLGGTCCDDNIHRMSILCYRLYRRLHTSLCWLLGATCVTITCIGCLSSVIVCRRLHISLLWLPGATCVTITYIALLSFVGGCTHLYVDYRSQHMWR